MEEGAEGTDDILLRDEAGDCRDDGLPLPPAKRSKEPGDPVSDHSEDTVVHIILSQKLKPEIEAGEEPDEDRREQDDGTRLLDEGHGALPDAL